MQKNLSRSPTPPNTAAGRLRRVQMADIAKLAGVSVATVSRALAGSTLINAETRARIEELAQSMNYSVNVGAKNLRMGHNRTIALVLPVDRATRQHVSDPFFLSLLGAIADAATDRDYELLLSRVDADHLNRAAALYDTGRAVGVLLIGQWHSHDQLNEMARRGVPVVVWGAHLRGQAYTTVGSDNLAGGRRAAEHLLRLGHRRILFIGDPELPEVRQRLQGMRAAYRSAGVQAPGEDYILRAPFAVDLATPMVQARLDAGPRFDAVFACSDLLAMLVMAQLHQRGISVPQQKAIVGFDDIEMSRHGHPSLTTVRQRVVEGGMAMVDTLLSLVAGEPVQSVVLPTELAVRGSSTIQVNKPDLSQ